MMSAVLDLNWYLVRTRYGVGVAGQVPGVDPLAIWTGPTE